MTWRLSMLLALVLMGAPLACDSPEGDTGPDITGTSDAGNTELDAGDTGGGEQTTDAQSDSGDPGPSDADDEADGANEVNDADNTDGSTAPDWDADVDYEPIDTNRRDTAGGPEVTGSCEEVVDLGELTFGLQEIEFDFVASNDHLRTSCRDLSAPSRPEKVFKFQVAERAILELNANNNTIFELRTDPCGDEASILACNPSGTILGNNLAAGVDYYLIVEFESDILDLQDVRFQIELESEFTECGSGETSCVSSSVANVCNELGSFEEKTCPTSCDGDSCVGDSCVNPITVNGSATMNSDVTAFSNKVVGYSCGQAGGVQPLSGQEVVFLAEGLTASQTIEVDATADVIANKIIIQRDACGVSAACEYYDLTGGESISHQVQQPGDYYIIVDGTDAASGTANYNVSIN